MGTWETEPNGACSYDLHCIQTALCCLKQKEREPLIVPAVRFNGTSEVQQQTLVYRRHTLPIDLVFSTYAVFNWVECW